LEKKLSINQVMELQTDGLADRSDADEERQSAHHPQWFPGLFAAITSTRRWFVAKLQTLGIWHYMLHHF